MSSSYTKEVLELLAKHTYYENELYKYAIQLNQQRIKQWEIEKRRAR